MIRPSGMVLRRWPKNIRWFSIEYQMPEEERAGNDDLNKL